MSKIREILLGVFIGVLASALVHWIASPPRGKPLDILPPPTPGPLVVYISGEVFHPGVYEISRTGRINDVVNLAGGLKESADLDVVNLAKTLRDGEKIFIPPVGYQRNESSATNNQGGASSHLLSQPININTATEKDLDLLPGIGPEKAAQIIRYREQHGSFNKKRDILKVPGIGEQIFNQIESLITIE